MKRTMELSCNGAGIPDYRQPIRSPASLPVRLQKKFGLHSEQGWKVSLFLKSYANRRPFQQPSSKCSAIVGDR